MRRRGKKDFRHNKFTRDEVRTHKKDRKDRRHNGIDPDSYSHPDRRSEWYGFTI